MDNIVHFLYGMALGGGFLFALTLLVALVAVLSGRVKFLTFKELDESQDSTARNNDYYGGDSW